MTSSSQSLDPCSTVSYSVLTLNGGLVVLVLNRDALLWSLLEQATANEPTSIKPHLRLCFDEPQREPDLLSIISTDVVHSMPITAYLDRQTVEGRRFSIVVQLSLHCLCRLDPIPCVANHSTTVASVSRQFLTIWHRRQQLPLDGSCSLLHYEDDERTAQWACTDNDSSFLTSWLLNGAHSPLPVRVRDAIVRDEKKVDETTEAARQQKSGLNRDDSHDQRHCQGQQGSSEAQSAGELVEVQLVSNGPEKDSYHATMDLNSTIVELTSIPYGPDKDRRIQHITYQGKPLPNHATLRECGLTSSNAQQLLVDFWPATALFAVTVKSLRNEQWTVCVLPGDTAQQLKWMLRAALGLPCNQQRIVFQGKQLDDAQTMAEVGMQDGSVAHLVLRLC